MGFTQAWVLRAEVREGVVDLGEERNEAGAFLEAVPAGVGALDYEDVWFAGEGGLEGVGYGADLDPDFGFAVCDAAGGFGPLG